MGIQNCAVFHDAPGMLPPNPIRTEVVADSNRVALALEPQQSRVPVTLVRAAARDPDFDVREWLTCFGDQLNIGVIPSFPESTVHARAAVCFSEHPAITASIRCGRNNGSRFTRLKRSS